MENCNFVTTVVPVQSCCDTLQLSVNKNSSGFHITLEVYAKLKLHYTVHWGQKYNSTCTSRSEGLHNSLVCEVLGTIRENGMML